MPNVVKAELFDRDLKKHVAAVHIENRLSLLERKMANVLLLNAYPELLEKDKHRVRVKDLADALGFDSNDRDYLKKALVNLMSTVLTWNIIDEKGNEKAWRARPMLIQADLERGWCIYAYSEDLRQKLYNPAIYSRINLAIQRKFTSGFAFALYENCLRYRRTGSTGWWALEVFRTLMGVADTDYYTDFRRLNSKVIKPAIAQVNQTSDIHLEVEHKRERRRVVALKFRVSENPQMSLFADRPELAPAPAEEDPVEQERERLRQRLADFGLNKREITQFLKANSAAYIDANLDIVADMQVRDAIKTTLRAAALDALKTDYRPKKAPLEVKQEAQKAAMKQQERQAKTATELEKLRKAFEKERLDQALTALSAQARKKLEGEFALAIGEGSDPAYVALRPMYRKSGIKHAAVQGVFRSFARARLLKDSSEGEFEAFLAQRENTGK